MLKIFKKPYDLYLDKSLIFIYANYYVMEYSCNETYGESIVSSYYHKHIADNLIELKEHDILFDESIKSIIRKFLRLSTKEIINNCFDETNRRFFASIYKRDELKIMVLGIRKELNKLIYRSKKT